MPFVRGSNLTLDKRSGFIGMVRGDIYITGESRLHFRELVNLRGVPVRSMYAYHYQSADGSLIFRYDDTRHYPQLPNFPHHKHDGESVFAVAGDLPTLASVLSEIEARIQE